MPRRPVGYETITTSCCARFRRACTGPGTRSCGTQCPSGHQSHDQESLHNQERQADLPYRTRHRKKEGRDHRFEATHRFEAADGLSTADHQEGLTRKISRTFGSAPPAQTPSIVSRLAQPRPKFGSEPPANADSRGETDDERDHLDVVAQRAARRFTRSLEERAARVEHQPIRERQRISLIERVKCRLEIPAQGEFVIAQRRRK